LTIGGQNILRVSPKLPDIGSLIRFALSFWTRSSRAVAIKYLDSFKLAGIIATWWTDTLPDFKTLLENGFPGVIDGWVDAIADAVEDE